MLPPQGYLEMLGLMSSATLVLTDSGGMQEETTALGVPCLTLRENTERPITIEQGTNTLVGRDRGAIERAFDEILRARASADACRSSGTAAPPSASPRTSPAGSPRRRARDGVSRSEMMRAPTTVLPGMAMCNALTIDVEDYFQVSALAPYIARSEWDTRECRVERNVERILAMLDEYGARATFFTLGWIAERYPQTHPPHRRQRPRAREPRLRAPARDRAEPGGVLLRHPAREDRARGSSPASK